jgi:tetratricopeptide (TPR) repeat protein
MNAQLLFRLLLGAGATLVAYSSAEADPRRPEARSRSAAIAQPAVARRAFSHGRQGSFYYGPAPRHHFGGYGLYQPTLFHRGFGYCAVVNYYPVAPVEVVGVPLLYPPFVEEGVALELFAPADDVALPLGADIVLPEPAGRAPREPRVSNAAARQRAARFMELGDRHFVRGDYLDAYERYKLAVQAAPDLVEAYLRRGQALVALGSYESAVQTFKYAFTLHPDWARSDYRLDRIYGNRRDAKLRHLNALAAAAEEQPSPELMLLIGAQLYYDGQADRSLKFFERAKELHRGMKLERAAEAPPQVGIPLRPNNGDAGEF